MAANVLIRAVVVEILSGMDAGNAVLFPLSFRGGHLGRAEVV